MHLPPELCAHVATRATAPTVGRLHAVSRHWNAALRLHAAHVWHTRLLEDFPHMLCILAAQGSRVDAATLYREQRRAASEAPLRYLPSAPPCAVLTDFLFTVEIVGSTARRIFGDGDDAIGVAVRSERHCVTCPLSVCAHGLMETAMPVVPPEVRMWTIRSCTVHVTRDAFTRCLHRNTDDLEHFGDGRWYCGICTLPDVAPMPTQYAGAVANGLLQDGDHYNGLLELEATLVLASTGHLEWNVDAFLGPSDLGDREPLSEFSEYAGTFLERLHRLTRR